MTIDQLLVHGQILKEYPGNITKDQPHHEGYNDHDGGKNNLFPE
jgi:hypothetical protein